MYNDMHNFGDALQSYSYTRFMRPCVENITCTFLVMFCNHIITCVLCGHVFRISHTPFRWCFATV